MRLAELLCKHPYDLSGGEQQRAALAKVMLTDADVMLLDEPTKGLDEGFKEELTEILKRVAAGGKCIVVTSHDVDFCARVADRCAMVFDGQINGEGRTRDFFTGNGFYTTPCERMSRGILDGTLFPEEIARSVRG
jgi:energy-coupling factor transport system ATP-binding protein